MAHHQRLHRIVLFGREKAEEAGQNEVRYDAEGAAWIKTGGVWRPRAAGKDRQSMSDSEMDQKAETDPTWKENFFRGILSTKTHVTSELLPPMLQSLRALRCRLRSVCSAAILSLGAPEGQTALEGSVEGCIPYAEMGIQVFPGCRLVNQTDKTAAVQVQKSCEEAFDALYNRESRVLELLVSYDAATRTLLQFAGGFRTFLDEFDGSLLKPFRQVADLLKEVTRIPCFLWKCEP